jgi:hypothetical protein
MLHSGEFEIDLLVYDVSLDVSFVVNEILRRLAACLELLRFKLSSELGQILDLGIGFFDREVDIHGLDNRSLSRNQWWLG